MIGMDQEFDKIEDKLTVNSNITAAREHVGEIKNGIKFAKMRARSSISLLPFNVIPKKMVIYLMCHVIMWISSSPVKTGVSDKYSPTELVTGYTMDFDRHCPAVWGEYVEGGAH